MIFTRYAADDPPPWANDPIEIEPIMIEARSILIRAKGRTRVLRLSYDALGIWQLSYTVRHRAALCEQCGCTQKRGCLGGCAWANSAHTLCTRCLEKELLP